LQIPAPEKNSFAYQTGERRSRLSASGIRATWLKQQRNGPSFQNKKSLYS
jgi:hypothetical protein